MKIKKQIVFGNVPYEISLTDEEAKDLMQELLDSNAEQMKICLDKAKEINEDKAFEIALALFDKSATASYTVVSSALNSKQQELVKKLREKMREKKD